MKYLLFVCATTLAVTGCKKKDDAAATAPAGDDCGSVIPAAIDRVMPEMAKQMTGLPPEKVAQIGPKMKEVLLTRCVADKWPAEHLACIAVGKTNADMMKCDKSLPQDAKDKLKADLAVAMKDILDLGGGPGAMGKPHEDTGSAAPAAGSDSGSGSAAAGSGS